MRPSLRTATALGTSLVALLPGAVAAQAVPGGQSYDWSGFYVGGTMGVVQQSNAGSVDYPNGITDDGFSFSGGDLYLDGDLFDEGLPTLFKLDARKNAIGVEAGYNYASGNFVFGIEGDYRAFGHDGTSLTQQSTEGGTFVTIDEDLSSLATIRARAGVSADRMLFFATAGLATGQSTLNTSLNYGEFGKGANIDGTSRSMPLGYVAGGGVEYALTDNVSIKGEALYYNLGRSSVTATNNGSTLPGGGPGGGADTSASPYTASVDRSGVVVSTGLNFRF